MNFSSHPKTMVKSALNRLGIGVYRTNRKGVIWSNPPSSKKHQRVLPNATYAPWLSDRSFLRVFESIKRHSLVDIYRGYELWDLAKQIKNVPGDILEVGVWRGGSGAILAEAVKDLPDKKVFLADTFTGVVKAGIKDTKYKGQEHSDTSESIVKDLVNSLSLTNVTILKGIFPEDTGSEIPGKIALLHCDVDVYQSSKDIFEWCLPRLSQGSVMIFDDYGFSGCEGVASFCEEIKNKHGLTFIHNLNGHGIFVKVAGPTPT